MLTIPGSLLAHMQQDASTIAIAHKITYLHPINGSTVLGLTTSPIDAVVNSVLYRADLGVLPSTMASQIGVTADKYEISGFFHADGITESYVYANVYEFADVETRLFNWADQTMASAFVTKGKIGDIRIDGRQWTIEVNDLIDLFSMNIVELTSSGCRADLFDERCKVKSSPSTWAATTAYTASHASDANVGSWVKPTTQNRRFFRCTTAGTSGGTEPSWNTTVGGTTSDGSVVWTTVNAFSVSGSVTSRTSNQIFADTTITEATGFFQFGKVLWLTGANQGFEMEIKSQTTTQVELYLSMSNTIAVGDTFTLFAGCDKIGTTCTTKFGNRYNMRAEEWKPSNKILTKVGLR